MTQKADSCDSHDRLQSSTFIYFELAVLQDSWRIYVALAWCIEAANQLCLLGSIVCLLLVCWVARKHFPVSCHFTGCSISNIPNTSRKHLSSPSVPSKTGRWSYPWYCYHNHNHGGKCEKIPNLMHQQNSCKLSAGSIYSFNRECPKHQ